MAGIIIVQTSYAVKSRYNAACPIHQDVACITAVTEAESMPEFKITKEALTG